MFAHGVGEYCHCFVIRYLLLHATCAVAFSNDIQTAFSSGTTAMDATLRIVTKTGAEKPMEVYALLNAASMSPFEDVAHILLPPFGFGRAPAYFRGSSGASSRS